MGSYFVSIALFSLALLILLLSLPLRWGKVKPNPWYGIRFTQSFKSPEHWYRINRYGAALLMKWSFTLVVLAAFFAVVPSAADSAFGFIALLVYPLTIFIPVLLSYRYARKLDEELANQNKTLGA